MTVKRVAIFADLHTGSTVAPWPESQVLVDGGKHKPNKYQRFLNKCLADAIEHVTAFEPDTIVLLGDMVQGGNPKKDMQLVTPKPSLHAAAAFTLLEPLTKIGATLYYMRGTEWHEGAGSDYVEALAGQLGCKRHPTTGAATWRRLYLEMGGQLVDFMHHVSVSSIRQYQATAVLRDAYNHKLELFNKYGRKLPPLGALVRAHAHMALAVQGDGVWGVRCPCWQLGTAYSDAKGNAILSDIGYTTIELTEDGLLVRQRKYAPPLPHIEKGAA